MMQTKGTFYGIVTIMVALLLISSSLAMVYYGQYQQEASQNQQHVYELDSTLKDYRTLAGDYGSGLSDLNSSISLLANAVSSMNTSTPAYAHASTRLSTLWSSYQILAKLNGSWIPTYSVKMLVDYGNGTSRWYNTTAIQPGWNAYTATVVLLNGRVEAVWYQQYGEHLVEAINDKVSGESNAWFMWTYQKSGWEVSQTGADAVQIYNGTVYAWTLCGYDTSFNPTCTP